MDHLRFALEYVLLFGAMESGWFEVINKGRFLA
jgi:hypothetical protein